MAPPAVALAHYDQAASDGESDGAPLASSLPLADGTAAPQIPTSVSELLQRAAATATERSRRQELTPAERQRLLKIRSLLLAMSQDAQSAPVSADAGAAESADALPGHWRALESAVRLLLDPEPGNDARALGQLRIAVHELAQGANLELRNLAFCTRVEGFGRYQAFPKTIFYPDQEVLLYVEVENFATTESAEGFETELQGSYLITNADGRRLAEQDFVIDRQSSRNARRDYFVPYRLYMPRAIEPGRYTLTLSMQDLKANKASQAKVEFTIAGLDPELLK